MSLSRIGVLFPFSADYEGYFAPTPSGIDPSNEKSRSLVLALRDRVRTLHAKHEGMVQTFPPTAGAEGVQPLTQKSRDLSAALRDRVVKLSDRHDQAVRTFLPCSSEEVTQLSTELEAERKKIQQLEKRYQESQLEVAHLKRTLERVDEKVGKADDAFVALHPEAVERLSMAEQSRLAMETRVRSLESRIVQGQGGEPGLDVGALHQRVQDAESLCKYHEEKNKELQALLQDRQRQIHAVGPRANEVESLRADVADIQLIIGEEVQYWRNQVEIQMEKVAAAEAQHASMPEELHHEIEALRTQNQGLVAESEMRHQVTQHLSDQLAARDQEIESLRDRLAELDGVAASTQEIEVMWRTEVEAVRQQHARDLDLMQQRAAQGELHAVENGHLRTVSEAQAAEVEMLRARDVGHQHALADLEAHAAEVEMLRARDVGHQHALADLEARAAAGDQARVELEQFRRSGISIAEVEVLRKRLIESQVTHRELDALRHEHEQLQQQCAVDMKALQQRLAKEHEHHCASLRLAVEHHQRENAVLQARHRDMQVQHQTLMSRPKGPSTKEHEELSQRCAHAQEQLDAAEAKNSRLEAALEQANAQSQQRVEYAAELVRLQGDNQSLQQDLREQLDAAEANSSRLEAALEQAQTAQQQCATYASELERVRQEARASASITLVYELEAENINLRDRVHQLEAGRDPQESSRTACSARPMPKLIAMPQTSSRSSQQSQPQVKLAVRSSGSGGLQRLTQPSSQATLRPPPRPAYPGLKPVTAPVLNQHSIPPLLAQHRW